MLKLYYYQISPKSSEAVKNAGSVLSVPEQRRADAFRFEQDRLLYTAGKVMSRQILASFSGVRPQDIIFGFNANDRPFVKYPELNNFDFNLSHSGDYVVLAISDKPVGVDIEKIKPIDINLAYECFHDQELAYLFSDRSEQLERFFRLWTLKESYIKATGDGLAYPLKSFYFDFAEQGSIVLCMAGSGEKSYGRFFTQFAFRDDYQLAVCSCEELSGPIKPLDLSDYG